jgi:hypothetical protein
MDLDALLPRHDENLVEQLTNLESCHAKGLSEKKGYDSTLELNKYQSKYGSITDGLVVEKGVDRVAFEEYMAANLDYEKITPNEKLPKLLDELDADIIVYTNLRPKYATKILEHLNIEPYINVIFGPTFEETNPSSQKTSAEKTFNRIKNVLDVDIESITYDDGALEKYPLLVYDASHKELFLADLYFTIGASIERDDKKVEALAKNIMKLVSISNEHDYTQVVKLCHEEPDKQKYSS